MSRSAASVLLIASALACTSDPPRTVTESNGDRDTTNGGGQNGDSPNSGGEGSPPPASRYRDLRFTFATVDSDAAAVAAGYQGKLLRGADGALYHGYFKYVGSVNADCDIAAFGGGPAPSPRYELRVGVRASPAAAWSVEIVTLSAVGPPNHATAMFGVDGVIDGAGRPTFAVAAGQAGLASCGSTDLVLATRTAASTWNVRAPVTDSGACCGDCTDPNCTAGTDVGAWAAVALAPGGTLAVAYVDYHNFWDQDGQRWEGYEFWRDGGGVSGIKPWSGFGAYGALVYSGATAISAYTHFSGPDLMIARRTGSAGATADWEHITLRSGSEVGERISMAVAPNGTVGLAYHERVDRFGNTVDDVLYCASSDGGVTWADCEQVHQPFRHLRMPSLAFDSASRPLVAFQDCDATDTCQAGTDGLRLAWRNDSGAWESIEVVSDDSTSDGGFASLVIDPVTDEPTIAYQDRGRGAAMVASGSFPGGG